MTLDMNTWGSGPPDDAVDSWLDDALRAVPLPDGFFARLSRLADAPPEIADERDRNDSLTRTRGLSGTSRRYEASTRDKWSR